jgi:hypothetical protein
MEIVFVLPSEELPSYASFVDNLIPCSIPPGKTLLMCYVESKGQRKVIDYV